MFYKILILSILFSTNIYGDEYVNGYTKTNGTYVQGYMKTSPNNTTSDNYSTKGNINPYTGQAGTKSNTDNYNSNIYNNTNPHTNDQYGYKPKKW